MLWRFMEHVIYRIFMLEENDSDVRYLGSSATYDCCRQSAVVRNDEENTRSMYAVTGAMRFRAGTGLSVYETVCFSRFGWLIDSQ